MLTPKQIKYRAGIADDRQVPFTNYGIAIAQIHGILDRSVEIFNLK
jgi:hypothetical protein